MRIRSSERTSTFAWSPANSLFPQNDAPILLAAGSVSGALDASFSTATELEIFDLNLSPASNSADSLSLKSLGAISSATRFNSLAWSPFQPDASKKYGVLAGGMESGELGVWDPLAIIQGKHDEAILVHQNIHSGPVRGLEFNLSKPNLLASGATDGEIYIWDLHNPSTPFSPGNRSQKLEDVTVLSWNPHHEYILATASNNGYTVVWDLRARKELITLAYPTGRKPITSLAWHPVEPLKLVTSADDDINPVVSVWDLKNAYAPERTVVGHTRGILSVAWNPKDSDMLLSCGKDNKVLLSNPNTGENVGELDETRNWGFQAQWCPRNPDLFAVSSFDGKLAVHSLQGVANTVESSSPLQQQADINDPFAQVARGYQQQQLQTGFKLKQAPKWLQRPCGAVFGFGGKLVSFGKAGDNHQVSIRVVPADPELVPRVEKLRYLLDESIHQQQIDSAQFIEFCGYMERSQEDSKIWKLLKILFNAHSPESLLEYLGFDPANAPGPKLSHLIEKLKLSQPEVPVTSKADQDPSDFASQIGGIVNGTSSPFNLYVGQGTSETADVDALITRSVILGDYEIAVQVCLKTDRFADALVIAHLSGSELFAKTQQEYFSKKSEKSYLRVVKGIAESQLMDVVENAELSGSWRDVVALVCTHAKQEDIPNLLRVLGDRLEKLSRSSGEDDRFGAVLCYLRAGDVASVVNMWVPAGGEKHVRRKSLKIEKTRVLTLQGLIEKITVFRKAVGFQDADLQIEDESWAAFALDNLYKTYAEYAFALVELGETDLAWRILELIPWQYKWAPSAPGIPSSPAVADMTNSIAVLKDRLFRSGAVSVPPNMDPGFPFEYVKVGYTQQPAQQFQQSVQQPVQQPVQQFYGQQQNTYQGYQSYGQTTNYASTTGYSQAQSQPGYSYQAQDTASVAKVPASPYSQYNPVPFTPSPRLSNAQTAPQFQNQTYAGGYSYQATSGYQSQTVPSFQPQTSYGALPNAPITPAEPLPQSYQGKTPNTAWNDVPAHLISNVNRRAKASAPTISSPFSNQPAVPANNMYAPAPANVSASPTLYPPSTPAYFQQQQQQPAPVVPPKPAEPPAKLRHPMGDRSHIPSAQKPIVDGLDKLLSSAKAICMGGPVQQKRLFEDSEKKINIFIDQLNNEEVNADMIASAIELVTAIESKDNATTQQMLLDLMTKFSAAPWILGIKQLLKAIEQHEQKLLMAQQQQQAPQGPPGPARPQQFAGPPMQQPYGGQYGGQQQFAGPPQQYVQPPPPQQQYAQQPPRMPVRPYNN